MGRNHFKEGMIRDNIHIGMERLLLGAVSKSDWKVIGHTHGQIP